MYCVRSVTDNLYWVGANDWKAILDPENAEYLWFLVESENEGLPEMENARLCMQGLKKFI